MTKILLKDDFQTTPPTFLQDYFRTTPRLQVLTYLVGLPMAERFVFGDNQNDKRE